MNRVNCRSDYGGDDAVKISMKKMRCRANSILCRLAKCCDASIVALAAEFHIDVVRSSVARMKDNFWFYFSKLV